MAKPLQRKKRVWAVLYPKQARKDQEMPEASIPDIEEPKLEAQMQEDSTSAPAPLGLETLPLEMKLSILAQIPDVETLDNLMLASRVYSALCSEGAGKEVVFAILHRELSPSLVVEAQAILEARRIWRNEIWLMSVEGFVHICKNEKRLASVENEDRERERGGFWPEEDVLEIVKRHSLIVAMVKEFCAETLAVHPVTKEVVDGPVVLSKTEGIRVQRAFYRFEIFRTLFAEKDIRKAEEYQGRYFGERELSDLFFSGTGMRAWEVEELACVRDWMFRAYGNVLEEVRELVHEIDMEVERDELRCFMRDEGEIEERARRQVQERRKHNPFSPFFVLGIGGLIDDRSSVAGAPNRDTASPRPSLSLKDHQSGLTGEEVRVAEGTSYSFLRPRISFLN
jgi:hypothetical protein